MTEITKFPAPTKAEIHRLGIEAFNGNVPEDMRITYFEESNGIFCVIYKLIPGGFQLGFSKFSRTCKGEKCHRPNLRKTAIERFFLKPIIMTQAPPLRPPTFPIRDNESNEEYRIRVSKNMRAWNESFEEHTKRRAKDFDETFSAEAVKNFEYWPNPVQRWPFESMAAYNKRMCEIPEQRGGETDEDYLKRRDKWFKQRGGEVKWRMRRGETDDMYEERVAESSKRFLEGHAKKFISLELETPENIEIMRAKKAKAEASRRKWFREALYIGYPKQQQESQAGSLQIGSSFKEQGLFNVDFDTWHQHPFKKTLPPAFMHAIKAK